MATGLRDSADWVDEGMDELREAIDEHFASRSKELGELRRGVEHLTRQRPSVFTRWGLAPLAKPRFTSASGTWSSSSSTPRTGLTWTDGRVADLKCHVRDASTRASKDIAEIKGQIEEFNEETSERRSNRQFALTLLSLALLGLSPLIARGVDALLA
jgi:hypothetical protein